MINELIKLIECFENQNKIYWIKALTKNNVVRGKLIYYFNLLNKGRVENEKINRIINYH